MSDNPILIIDDDQEDMDLIREVINHLNIERSIHYFKSGRELESFLKTSATAPFLIICDVNLPEEDGFAIKTA
jgi:CheY-like chemotaxis protein